MLPLWLQIPSIYTKQTLHISDSFEISGNTSAHFLLEVSICNGHDKTIHVRAGNRRFWRSHCFYVHATTLNMNTWQAYSYEILYEKKST